MQVKLVRHTPEPEKTVAMSARLCDSPIGAAQLEEKISFHAGTCYLYLCH